MQKNQCTLGDSQEDVSLMLARQYTAQSETQPVMYGEVKDWQENNARKLYEAQKIVNQLDSNALNVYRLFRSVGLPVSWPNFFQRLQIRREQRKVMKVAQADIALRKKIITLFEEIQSLRKRDLIQERFELRNSIIKFNSLITQHGDRLGLNYRREQNI
ncbi:MAG: hypothetical protein V4686_02875 [Patescibacteria group bacterium]